MSIHTRGVAQVSVWSVYDSIGTVIIVNSCCLLAFVYAIFMLNISQMWRWYVSELRCESIETAVKKVRFVYHVCIVGYSFDLICGTYFRREL